METSQKDTVECWDDDEDFQGFDGLHLRNASTATTTTHMSRTPSHRDSISSRQSARSDMEDECDWQLHLPADDDNSTSNAIANAKSKGIPLPANVPASALLGGTIRRLGGRKVKKILGDDWGDDLEINPEKGLKLKISDEGFFPETIRQVSIAADLSPSPSKPLSAASFTERLQAAGKSSSPKTNLDQFRDDEDDFGDFPTIKVAKNRSALKVTNINSSPVNKMPQSSIESFDDDLEIPEDGELKLSARKEIPKTPTSQSIDDVDTDWAEGSQASFGASHGGTRRTGRSNRSSSFSALSPSVFSPSLSSCFTAESEDEGLEGLVLPDGPIKFEEALRKRLETVSPEQHEPTKADAPTTQQEDFFSGIEIGQGDFFDSGKLTLNRNVKHKSARSGSPKRPATTLTFTNKPAAPITRIPKPAGTERSRSKLDTVPESGGPVHALRRTQSRLGGHSNQSSITSIPTPTASTFSQSPGPSTPSRRGLNTRKSKETMKVEPTTTGAQLLKSKRSMPLLNSRNQASQASPARNQPPFARPSSRTDKNNRSGLPSRPKTPVDRIGAESSLAAHRKPPIPFLPAGNTHASSHHVTSKSSRTFHRPTSSDSNSNENASLSSRSISRLSNPRHRPTTPTSRRDVAPASLVKMAASKSQLTQPKRRRVFGDGSELDVFDDLPTSAAVESKFVKPKASAGKQSSKSNMRSLYSLPNQSAPSIARAEPRTPLSPQKSDANQVPRFAQSTTASLARKQRSGAISPQALRHPPPTIGENAINLSTTWKATTSMKPLPPPRAAAKRIPKKQQKPHLIQQLNNSSQHRTEKGMHYNPDLFRWEGNEHVLAPFDVPASPRHMTSTPSSKPALIANFGSTKGVQVVGGMVFDPQRMCWLKMAPNTHRGRSDSGAVSVTTEDEEEDPFAGFEDLKDDVKTTVEVGAGGTKASKNAGSDDDWTVGEEFDVGPGFVRRQTTEEAKWKRRLEGWSAVFKAEKMWEARWEVQALVHGRS